MSFRSIRSLRSDFTLSTKLISWNEFNALPIMCEADNDRDKLNGSYLTWVPSVFDFLDYNECLCDRDGWFHYEYHEYGDTVSQRLACIQEILEWWTKDCGKISVDIASERMPASYEESDRMKYIVDYMDSVIDELPGEGIWKFWKEDLTPMIKVVKPQPKCK